MATAEGIKGRGRITVFSMFGPVFGYASRFADGQQVAYIGPLTPGINWGKLWQMADRCCRPQDSRPQWIITQANRSFISGSDVVVRLSDADWEMEPGGRLVELGGSYANQDVLVTGNLTVPDLTAEQIAPKFTYYPQYAG
ncbi:hypothetical protein [Streptomyces sp. 1222.5]|uniref:hypothetical protein n=1 Tax=Streptomyces sp. 1222.5 TaxID=1881026 RepID=UPI003EB7EC9C